MCFKCWRLCRHPTYSWLPSNKWPDLHHVWFSHCDWWAWWSCHWPSTFLCNIQASQYSVYRFLILRSNCEDAIKDNDAIIHVGILALPMISRVEICSCVCSGFSAVGRMTFPKDLSLSDSIQDYTFLGTYFALSAFCVIMWKQGNTVYSEGLFTSSLHGS